MGWGVRVHVWGDYALFARPEMKVERCSYDVMPPSAARGILEAIYWHPGMRWVIDRIQVRKPIRFTSIRRNEVKSKVLAGNVLRAVNGSSKPLYIASKEEIVQREDGDGREQDLGYMLYDFDYSDPEDIKPMFFRAVLRNGILDVRDCEVVR